MGGRAGIGAQWGFAVRTSFVVQTIDGLDGKATIHGREARGPRQVSAWAIERTGGPRRGLKRRLSHSGTATHPARLVGLLANHTGFKSAKSSRHVDCGGVSAVPTKYL